MKVDTDSLGWRDLPAFLPDARTLLDRLQQLSDSELQTLWKCSEQLAVRQIANLRQMDLDHNLTPAILSYEGIQYQYMAPGVFTSQALDYIAEHLRILSGFYGILRPFDGVAPYRLEMQARLRMGEAKDLYAFWGDRLARHLFSETDCVLNLASKEYNVCISRYLPSHIRFVTCVFGEEKNGKIIEKGTLCKMARGEMVRYLAERRITTPEEAAGFSSPHYQYAEAYSNESTLVFLRKG